MYQYRFIFSYSTSKNACTYKVRRQLVLELIINATVENTSNEVAYRTTREGNESLQYEPNLMMALPTFRSQGGVSLPRTHTSLACD